MDINLDHLGSVDEIGEVVVAKFGGASMSNMHEVAAVIRSLQRRGHRVIAVCSALEGMTDTLKGLGERAAHPEWPDEWEKKVWKIKNPFLQPHLDLLHKLLPLPHRTEKYLRDLLDTGSGQLRRNLESINDVGEFSQTIHGKVLGNGELSSTPMLAGLLGDHALYEHSRKHFITDRNGRLLPDLTYPLLRLLFDDWTHDDPNRALILAGYVGKSPDGLLTVTDRGGTDTWAVHTGIALKSRGVKTVLLFKRGPGGIESADYRIVKGTRTYIWVTIEELDELVNGGAKVVAPTAVSAALDEDIRIWVGTSELPQNPGTWILRNAPHTTNHTLRMVTAQKGLTLFGVTPCEGTRVGGKVFGALDQARIEYQIVSGVRNMRQMGFTTHTIDAPRTRALIDETLQIEVFQNRVVIQQRDGMALISGIGECMAGHQGVSARFYDGIAMGQANVVVQVQCPNERLITVVVIEDEVAGALQGVHEAFALDFPSGDTHDITH